MMRIMVIYLAIFEIVYSQNIPSNPGRKYYFKMGRNNSEFKGHNRIFYLNHNITDYEYPNRRVETTSASNSEEKIKNTLQYLDEDWNYRHKNQSKTNLPRFIQKFYEKSSEDQSPNTDLKILFNTNKNSSSPILRFNLDSLNPNETVLDADLYFYWPLSNASSIFRESVVLRLYQYERQFNEESNETEFPQNPDVHKLFNVIYVSKAQRGWQIFKVKKPIDNWLSGEENLGLILTISSYDNNTSIDIFNDTNQGIFRTFLVAREKNNNTFSKTEDSSTNSMSTCHKKEWSVNFRNLGWDQVIISPEGFAAYDCAGKCSKSTDENQWNHAKILSISQKRSPCCVPVKYRSMPIMYFDKFDNIVIKNYDNIIVDECGCR
ncbi:hypothetical protein JTB14_032669 [Gonioctena quinquepunctata]|nr:hypothetical protein JTB14_032669 [Gonioctena quinquepunctata]